MQGTLIARSGAELVGGGEKPLFRDDWKKKKKSALHSALQRDRGGCPFPLQMWQDGRRGNTRQRQMAVRCCSDAEGRHACVCVCVCVCVHARTHAHAEMYMCACICMCLECVTWARRLLKFTWLKRIYLKGRCSPREQQRVMIWGKQPSREVCWLQEIEFAVF